MLLRKAGGVEGIEVTWHNEIFGTILDFKRLSLGAQDLLRIGALDHLSIFDN